MLKGGLSCLRGGVCHVKGRSLMSLSCLRGICHVKGRSLMSKGDLSC